MPDSLTADELLTSIRVLNQVFEVAPKERIKSLLLRIEELHRPIADCYLNLLRNADTERLYTLQKQVVFELDRLQKRGRPITRTKESTEFDGIIRQLEQALVLSTDAGLAELDLSITALKKAGTVKDFFLLPLAEYWSKRAPADAMAVGTDTLLTLASFVPFVSIVANVVSIGRLAKELIDEPHDLKEAASRMNLILAAEIAVRWADSGHLDSIIKASRNWDATRKEAQSMIDSICDQIDCTLAKSRRCQF